MKKFEKNDLIINKVKAHPKSRVICYNGTFLVGSSLLPLGIDYLLTEDGYVLVTEGGEYPVESIDPFS